MNFSILLANWKPVTEIAILWFLIYQILLFLEGTRAVQVLRGLIVLLVAFFVVQSLNLKILEWLITKLFAVSVIAFLIIFHPEIRQGLARLGRQQMFGTPLREEEIDSMLRELGLAVENLSADKHGAIIAVEKSDPLTSYSETGVAVDARVSADLVQTIFTPTSILHDGGLIIQHGRIAAAGCIFNLTDKQDLSRVFGTRHRAALGLSEETDAVIIVVSEERGEVSLVYRGRLQKDMSSADLMGRLKEILKQKKEHA